MAENAEIMATGQEDGSPVHQIENVGAKHKIKNEDGNKRDHGSDEDTEGAVDGDGSEYPHLDKATILVMKPSSGSGAGEQKMEESQRNNLDANILLQLLPPEIWDKVADCLGDANDFLNLIKSSSFFGKLLKSKKTLCLFPKVWDILGRKYLENHHLRTVYNERFENYGTAPNVICGPCGRSRRTRFYSGILKLRLVSKIWSDAVDKLFRCVSLQKEHDQVVPRPLFPRMHVYWLRDTGFNMARRCTQFLRHFDGTHTINGEDGPNQRSPFLSGNIAFSGETAFNILQLYGHHVQQCNIEIWRRANHANISPAEIYSFYRKSMGLMPNLKTITFSEWHAFQHGNHNDPGVEHRLSQEIASRPMPFLKNLELLKFQKSHSKICNSALRLNRNVSTLIAEDLRHEDNFDMYTIPFPNLQRLSIVYHSEQNFQKFINWESNLNLTHLDLQLYYIPKQFSTVFDTISRKCGDTLNHLSLVFDDFRNPERLDFQEELPRPDMNLPNLKTFKFNSNHLWSLEFLLPVHETLEHLEVYFWGCPDLRTPQAASVAAVAREKEKVVSGEGKIKFMSCVFARSLEESNIWGIFLKLKRIRYMEYVIWDEDNSAVDMTMSRDEWELKKGESGDENE